MAFNILIDIDSFEVQVRTKGHPELQLQPLVVHNSAQRIVAVSYPAKAEGVRRSDRIEEAKKKCPELTQLQIEDRFGKPDQKTSRDDSYNIRLAVTQFVKNLQTQKNVSLCRFSMASKDELFLEIELNPTTAGTYERKLKNKSGILYSPRNTLTLKGEFNEDEINECLEIGGNIAWDLLDFIKTQTGFQGSAGVGHNKTIAKLACNVNKPAGVTVVHSGQGVDELYKLTKLEDATYLKGKIGQEIQENFTKKDGSQIETLLDVRDLTQEELLEKFPKKKYIIGKIIHVANAIDDTHVEDKPKAGVSCSRSTYNKVRTDEDYEKFLKTLCEELAERLAEEMERNNRQPQLIKLSNKRKQSAGKTFVDSGTFSCPIHISDEELFNSAMEMLTQNWEKLAAKGMKDKFWKSITKIEFTARNFV